MKALGVFPASREVKLIEHREAHVAAPTDVKLRMLEVGVCGTDREIVAFEYGTPPPGFEYLVLGHESLGEVVMVGNAVTRVKVGDLVVPMVRRPCSHDTCVPCRSARQDFCTTGDFTERGIKGAHGFMTEFVVDDERYLNVVPKALRDIAVLTEPLTIAEKAFEQVQQVQRRLPWECEHASAKGWGHCHRAVVLGAGPVGLLGAMKLAAAGFETFVYSRGAGPRSKAHLVDPFGAHYVAAETHSIDQLAQRVGNIDLVYEATGASRVAFDLMRVLGVNGIFVFTGVPGRKAPIAVDTDLIMRDLVLENQVVFGTVNAARSAYEAAVADLGLFDHAWPGAARALISSRRALKEAPDLLLSPAAGIKNVVVIPT